MLAKIGYYNTNAQNRIPTQLSDEQHFFSLLLLQTSIVDKDETTSNLRPQSSVGEGDCYPGIISKNIGSFCEYNEEKNMRA